MKPMVLIISHGSREETANREFRRLVQKYRKRHPGWKIAHAFLELAKPSILEVLEILARKSDEILVLPLFLFSAKHVKEHIPAILAAFRKEHPKTQLKLAEPLGSDPLLLDLLDQRLRRIHLK
jgi:sirohydrochlorin cobaltochelatase